MDFDNHFSLFFSSFLLTKRDFPPCEWIICLQELFAGEIFSETRYGNFQGSIDFEDLALESALVSDRGVEV